MVWLGRDSGVVVTYVDAEVGSGLVLTEDWDWPAVVRERLPEVWPDVIVTLIGTNDGVPMWVDGVRLERNSPEWFAAYRPIVAAFMDQLAAAASHVYWVGLPPMEKSGFTARMAEYNEMYQELIDARPNITYVSSWEVLTDSQGMYQAEIPVEDGDPIPLRDPDGIHFAAAGANRVARQAFQAIAAGWGFLDRL